MFDIGFSELVVIALVALIVLGPQRLPEVARTAGRWAGQARRFMQTVKSDFEREMTAADLDQLRKLQQELAETRTLIEAPVETLIEESKPAQLASPVETPALEAPAPKAQPAAAASDKAAKPKAAARKKHGGTRKRAAR